MRTLATVIAIILLASMVLNGWLLWDRKQSEKDKVLVNQQWQEKIDKHLATAQTAARRADSLQASFENRRTRDSLALSGLRNRNKAMSENVQILREPVQPLIDSIHALGMFVKAYDSLLAGKDEEINELTLRHEAQIVDLQALIFEQSKQILAQAAISDAWRETAAEAQKQARKEKRGKKFWQWTAGGVTAIALFLAVQP